MDPGHVMSPEKLAYQGNFHVKRIEEIGMIGRESWRGGFTLRVVFFIKKSLLGRNTVSCAKEEILERIFLPV